MAEQIIEREEVCDEIIIVSQTEDILKDSDKKKIKLLIRFAASLSFDSLLPKSMVKLFKK